jgi:hypothetical protein
MKYFTREMWAGWQSRDPKVSDAAFKAAKVNIKRYRKSLEKVAPLLGKHGKFFTDHSLHDGQVLQFGFLDAEFSRREWRRMRDETVVRFRVLGGSETALIYHLTYKGIRELQVQTRNDLFSLENSRFGDWGYDELSREKNWFRHSILFQTGSEISIAFETFTFKVERATSRKVLSALAAD